MALPASGQISLINLQVEFGGAIPLSLDSYRSQTTIAAGQPLALSDFYGLSGNIHGTSFVADYNQGQYISTSGYDQSTGTGSMNDKTIGTYQGSTNVYIEALMNFSGTINLVLGVTSGTKIFTNSGFTSLNLYLGQNTNAGNPDLTLNRTAGNFTSNNNQATWAWNTSQAVTTYFGSTSTTNFMEML